MDEKKKKYLRDQIKTGNFILALFITSFALTILAFLYEYNLIGKIFETKKTFLFTSILAGFFLLMGLIYIISKIRCAKINFADSLYLPIFLVGLIMACYVIFYLKSTSLYHILFYGVTALLGLILLITRSVCYKKNTKLFRRVYDNTVASYFGKITEKFSFPVLIILSVFTICLSYIIIKPSFIEKFTDIKILAMSGFLLIPTIIYCIKSLFSKSITPFDALLVSAFMSFPVMFVEILFTALSPLRLTVWAGLFAIFFIVIMIRLAKYDMNYIPETTSQKLFRRWDFYLAFAIAGFTTLISLILLETDAIGEFVKDGKFNISFGALPVAVVIIFSVGSLLVYTLCTLFSLGKKGTCASDFLLSICAMFVVFTWISLLARPSVIMLYLLVCYTVVILLFMAIRLARSRKAR